MAGEALEPGDEGAGQRGKDAGGLGAEKVEHGCEEGETGESDGIRRHRSHVEALSRGRRTSAPLPRRNCSGILERVRCSSPAAAILASSMDLDLVELVECSEGCGHWLFSDRGPVRCPCHGPAAAVVQLVRSEVERVGVCG